MTASEKHAPKLTGGPVYPGGPMGPCSPGNPGEPYNVLRKERIKMQTRRKLSMRLQLFSQCLLVGRGVQEILFRLSAVSQALGRVFHQDPPVE